MATSLESTGMDVGDSQLASPSNPKKKRRAGEVATDLGLACPPPREIKTDRRGSPTAQQPGIGTGMGIGDGKHTHTSL